VINVSNGEIAQGALGVTHSMEERGQEQTAGPNGLGRPTSFMFHIVGELSEQRRFRTGRVGLLAQTLEKAEPMLRLRDEFRPRGCGICAAVTLVGALYPAIGCGLNLGEAEIAFSSQGQVIIDHQKLGCGEAKRRLRRSTLCRVLEVPESLLQEWSRQMALNGAWACEELMEHSRASFAKGNMHRLCYERLCGVQTTKSYVMTVGYSIYST